MILECRKVLQQACILLFRTRFTYGLSSSVLSLEPGRGSAVGFPKQRRLSICDDNVLLASSDFSVNSVEAKGKSLVESIGEAGSIWLSNPI